MTNEKRTLLGVLRPLVLAHIPMKFMDGVVGTPTSGKVKGNNVVQPTHFKKLPYLHIFKFVNSKPVKSGNLCIHTNDVSF